MLLGATKRKPRHSSGRIQLPRDVDGRTVSARRFRDLIAGYTAEIGEELTAVERDLISQAAGLTLRAEQMQAQLIQGLPVDADQLIRITSTGKRVLGAISAKASKRQSTRPTALEQYLANKAAQAADEPEAVGDI